MKQCFQKILLVDDDYIMKFVTDKIMKLSGFTEEVASVINGFEAQEYLIKTFECNLAELPDLIFLDFYMNVMSGWEFLDWYKRWTLPLEKYPPVYIVSSAINDEDSIRANTYKQVIGFIKKPITVEDLKEILAVHFN